MWRSIFAPLSRQHQGYSDWQHTRSKWAKMAQSTRRNSAQWCATRRNMVPSWVISPTLHVFLSSSSWLAETGHSGSIPVVGVSWAGAL